MPRIETEFVDTSTVPRENQHLVWAAQSHAARLEPETIVDGFDAKGAFWRLGPVLVGTAQVDPFHSARDGSAIASNPVGYVLVVLLIEGEMVFTADGGEQRCVAPCCVFFDYARPYAQRTTRTSVALAYVARDFLEEATGPIAAHGVLPETAELMLFRETMATLVRVLPFVAASSRSLYARMLRDQVAAALHAAPRIDAGRHVALRHAAEHHIATHPACALDVAAMAVDLGISRSRLFALFRADGGVVSFARTRRLRAVYRAVSDPAEERPFGVLGEAHGFFDAYGLARSFRRAFGCSLTELRRRTRVDADHGVAGDTSFDRLRESVAKLDAGG